MATKTISLELDAYDKLKLAKQNGESFSAVVRRARFDPTDSRGDSILQCLASLRPGPADQKAMEAWNRDGLRDRGASPSPWESDERS
jgi:hypothetical protein